MGHTTVYLDSAQQLSFKSLDLFSAGALAVPLQVLSALDAGHLDGRQLAECLAGDIGHGRRAAAGIAGKIFFLQCFSGSIAIRTVLIKAVADLRMKKTVRGDLDEVSTVTAAEPDDLSVKALRSLLDRYQMAKSLVADILYFSSAAFHFFIPCHCRHTLILNPF